MNVAVLTLTRDRLDYTRHCFATLRENAGCDYDHYVLDNASSDGTLEWLLADETFDVTSFSENIGICRALNHLLANACEPARYDVIVRFDNDCEVLQPDTLRTVAETAFEHEAILAPHVRGLLNPPPAVSQRHLGEHTVSETAILGGIFMAIPASLFAGHRFRYDNRNPTYAGDEAIVPWWRARGGVCGYLDGWEVNHYETTVGQQERFPEYHRRKVAEMATC